MDYREKYPVEEHLFPYSEKTQKEIRDNEQLRSSLYEILSGYKNKTHPNIRRAKDAKPGDILFFVKDEDLKYLSGESSHFESFSFSDASFSYGQGIFSIAFESIKGSVLAYRFAALLHNVITSPYDVGIYASHVFVLLPEHYPLLLLADTTSNPSLLLEKKLFSLSNPSLFLD